MTAAHGDFIETGSSSLSSITQRHKLHVAPSPGPVYVPLDLSAQSAWRALERRGFAADAPAVYLMEGVTMYLDVEVVTRQLRELASTCACGSRLLVNFTPPADVGSARDRRLQRLIRLGRPGSGESFQLRIDRAGAAELVRTAGWQVEECLSFREVAVTLLPAASRLPAHSVSDQQSLVSATVA